MNICGRCNVNKPDEDYFKSQLDRANRKRHKIWCKICMHDYQKTNTANMRRMVFVLLCGNNKPLCQCCGEIRDEFLTLDHINGRKSHEKGMYDFTLYRHILDERKNGIDITKSYRVLCINCNFSLGMRGYCPHEREREDEKRLLDSLEWKVA
jgi:hypothetical protein